MKMQRTSILHYMLCIGLGLAGGITLAYVSERWQLNVLGVPWLVSALLLLAGIVVFFMARQVYKYATGERKELDPQYAVNSLILSKVLGTACSALLGWYGGQAIMCLSHREAPYYAHVIIQCAVAALVCLLDVLIGAVGEWMCQLPPKDGPDNPKQQQNHEKHRIAAAAQKHVHTLDGASASNP